MWVFVFYGVIIKWKFFRIIIYVILGDGVGRRELEEGSRFFSREAGNNFYEVACEEVSEDRKKSREVEFDGELLGKI